MNDDILVLSRRRFLSDLDKRDERMMKLFKKLLDEKDNEKNDVIGITEAAELTGLSKNTIYQYSSRNQIPKLEGKTKKLLFSRKELLVWINADRPKFLENAINDLIKKQSPNQFGDR